jgi:hypothetical protein
MDNTGEISNTIGGLLTLTGMVGWILIGLYCGIRNYRSYLRNHPDRTDSLTGDYTFSPGFFIKVGVFCGPIGLFVKF